jgi:hypothetical protein
MINESEPGILSYSAYYGNCSAVSFCMAFSYVEVEMKKGRPRLQIAKPFTHDRGKPAPCRQAIKAPLVMEA